MGEEQLAVLCEAHGCRASDASCPGHLQHKQDLRLIRIGHPHTEHLINKLTALDVTVSLYLSDLLSQMGPPSEYLKKISEESDVSSTTIMH